MPAIDDIRGGMELVGSDGGHVGTVDGKADGQVWVRLAPARPGDRAPRSHPVPLRCVMITEGGRVMLNLPARLARSMAAGGPSREA